MNPKYDWSNVPEYINYLATEPCGWAFGYKEKPTIVGCGFEGEFSHYLLKPNEHDFNGDWQDSLEERPIRANDGMQVALGE